MLWLIGALFLPCGCFAQTLTQTPVSITKAAMKSVRFQCRFGAEFSVIHWYQQIAGQALVRILYYEASTIREPEFSSRFKADTSDSVCTLIINDIAQTDAATYFCASWDNRDVKIFGPGTKLVVTDKPPVGPTIRLFPPNTVELARQSKAPLVCLLTGFFPEVIKVHWEVSGKPAAVEEVSTGSVEEEEDGSYSVISRLDISKINWETKRFSCGAEHESNSEKATIDKNSQTAIDETNDSPAPTCPPIESRISESTDEEGPPLSSLQVATFTYMLLLVKSVVYCGIISFILYKAEYRDAKKSL